jgi:O-antigen/teichoic acid export membrane protein
VSTTQTSSVTSQFSLRRLVRGSTSRVAQLSLSTVIGFFLTPFIVNSLGPQQYGIWALAFACIGYYSLLDLGMSAAVFTHISYALGQNNREEASRIYSTGLAVFGCTGIALAILTCIISAVMWSSHHAHGRLIAEVVLLVGLLTASSFPMRVPFGTLNAGSHFDVTSGLTMLALCLRTLGFVIVLELHHGVLALAVVSVLASLPVNLLTLVAVKRKYPFVRVLHARFHGAIGKRLVHFGLPVIFGQLADRVRMQTDSITVSFFLGLIALAHYNIATTLVMYYADGIQAIIGVLAPVLTMQKSMNDQAGVRRSILAGTRVGVCASGFLLFAIVVFGHAFLLRWMGSTYLDAYPVLVVLACAVFLDVSQGTSVSAFYATLNQQYYAILNVTEAVANLVLSIVLAKPLGMMGIALGTLIPAIVVRLFVQPVLVQQRLGLTVREYWSVSGRTAIRCAACLVLPFLLCTQFLRPTYVSLFSLGGLSLILFAVPIWHFEFGLRGAADLKRSLSRRFFGQRREPAEINF